MRSERGASLIGLLLALVIIGGIAWLVISRTASNGVGGLADAGLQLDETKQRRTLADMKTIGDAIRLMQADTGAPPATLAELESGGYLRQVNQVDGWGNAYVYAVTPTQYSLTSLGADGRAGPAAPDNWRGGSYVCDLELTNGQFTQAPTAR